MLGTSAGGTAALAILLAPLPETYPLSVIVVQHLHPWQAGAPLIYGAPTSALPVREVVDKEPVRAGCVYFAPANYHLLIEDDRTFALSIDEKVNYSRPAIDVLFESAVDVYGSHLIGVVLTGASQDGARGLRRIKESGGLTIVQDPATAEAPYMPESAVAAMEADYVLPLPEIGALLVQVGK